MFTTLIETSALNERGTAGYLLSVALHSMAIGLAVVATHRVVGAVEHLPAEAISYVSPPVPAPVPDIPPRPAASVAAPPPPKGFQVLQAPIDIPDVLPAIDLTKPVTNAADYTARGAPGGTADGVPGGVPRPVGDAPSYLASQVEKVAALIPGTGTPEYPEALKAAGLDGEVQVSFVVDTTGRAEAATIAVLAATHPRFTDAVVKALPRMRFRPAEISGRKVRQLVLLPLVFSIR